MKIKVKTLRNSYIYSLVFTFLFLVQSCFLHNNVLDKNLTELEDVLVSAKREALFGNEEENEEVISELKKKFQNGDSQDSSVTAQRFSLKQMEESYQSINDKRYNNLRLLYPEISYDYKAPKSSDRFYKTLNTAHNSWLFYAADIKRNPNASSSLTPFVKERRYNEIKTNWLYLMNSKFKSFFVKNEITSLCEKVTTFGSPSGKTDNICSFITIKNNIFSSRCYLYIKPPNDFKFCTLNQYKVTKMFYDDVSDCTFIELKLKSKVAIVYLYLKSDEFSSIMPIVPEGTVISTGTSQPKKTAKEVMNEEVTTKTNKWKIKLFYNFDKLNQSSLRALNLV